MNIENGLIESTDQFHLFQFMGEMLNKETCANQENKVKIDACPLLN